MKRLSINNLPTITVILASTFILAYIPTLYTVLTSDDVKDPIAALKRPDVVGGLIGFVFSVLLTIGESHSRIVNESIDSLNRKIDAQSKGNKLQEAFLKAKEGPYSSLFGKLAERRLERIQSDLDDMKKDLPFYEVRQNDPVKEYVDIFVQLMMDIIHQGSEFRVVTTEVIWSPSGFGGPNGRYLLANYVAAKQRQVKLKRIFMAPQMEELKKSPNRAKELLNALSEHKKIFLEQKDEIDVDFSVYEAESDADYHGFFKHPSNNFALWNVSATDRLCTVVEYTHTLNNAYAISGFKFSSEPMLIKEKSAVFENLHKRSKPLSEYIQLLEAFLKEPSL